MCRTRFSSPAIPAADANPDIGDSAITETNGLGGFAIAAAPAIVQFVGGSSEDALRYTRQMYEITAAENNIYQIPGLNFRGTPTGIDVRQGDRDGTSCRSSTPAWRTRNRASARSAPACSMRRSSHFRKLSRGLPKG